MEQVKALILLLKEYERRAIARPCSCDMLRALDTEFENKISEVRKGEAWLGITTNRQSLAEVISATDSVRKAIRGSLQAHLTAQNQVQNLRTLLTRGHVRDAVVKSGKVRRFISPFTDLNIEFLGEAISKHEHHQRRLVILALVSTAAILIAGTTIRVLTRSHGYKP
jgi:hypothetical protein